MNVAAARERLFLGLLFCQDPKASTAQGDARVCPDRAAPVIRRDGSDPLSMACKAALTASGGSMPGAPRSNRPGLCPAGAAFTAIERNHRTVLTPGFFALRRSAPGGPRDTAACGIRPAKAGKPLHAQGSARRLFFRRQSPGHHAKPLSAARIRRTPPKTATIKPHLRILAGCSPLGHPFGTDSRCGPS